MAWKRTPNYSAQMRLLRKMGAVNFNYDLRKSLSRGQKANITKAIRQLGTAPKDTTAKQFFRFKTKREQQIAKRAMGQSGSMLRGVVKVEDKNTKARIVNGQLRFETKTRETTIVEQIVPIPPPAKTRAAAWLKRARARYARQGYTQIQLIFSNGTSSGNFGLELDSHVEAFDDLVDAFDDADKYGGASDGIVAISIR